MTTEQLIALLKEHPAKRLRIIAYEYEDDGDGYIDEMPQYQPLCVRVVGDTLIFCGPDEHTGEAINFALK